MSALLMGNPWDLIGGTSLGIKFQEGKTTVNFIRAEGSLISTAGASIDEMLIRERREGLSFSGFARKCSIHFERLFNTRRMSLPSDIWF